MMKKEVINVITRFDDRKLIEGMAVVASSIKKFHDRAIISVKNYIGYIGKHYIASGVPRKEKFAPSILGVLRRIAIRLDKVGDAPISLLSKIAMREIIKNGLSQYRVRYY